MSSLCFFLKTWGPASGRWLSCLSCLFAPCFRIQTTGVLEGTRRTHQEWSINAINAHSWVSLNYITSFPVRLQVLSLSWESKDLGTKFGPSICLGRVSVFVALGKPQPLWFKAACLGKCFLCKAPCSHLRKASKHKQLLPQHLARQLDCTVSVHFSCSWPGLWYQKSKTCFVHRQMYTHTHTVS